MKKFFVFIGVLLGVLVLLVLVAGLTMPRDVVVTRSILIKAPKDSVFAQVAHFRNWPNWNPWHALDTNMKITYAGTDGTPGSSYTWDSKKGDVGAGTTSNTGISASQMDFHIDFDRPFKNTADGSIKTVDTAGLVKATWTFHTTCPFPLNGLQLFPFLNMKRMVGDAFDIGLAKLKKYSESHVVPPPAIPVKEIDYPAHLFIGMRQTMGFNDIMQFCGQSYAALSADQKLKDRIVGPPAGLYFTWDTATQSSDMVAGYPVSDSGIKVKDAVYFYQEAGRAFTALHKGSYQGIGAVHMAIAKALAAKGRMPALTIEEYLVGPGQEPDSTKWVTSIYYLVK